MKIWISALFLLIPVFLRAQNIITICGNGSPGDLGDGGPATTAEINGDAGGVFDIFDNYYFTEGPGNRIRKVSYDGIITAYAGSGMIGYSGDGGAASLATLQDPKHLATDRAGNLYIADAGNSAIRRVDATTHIITTIAGNGSSGYSGDGGPASAALLGEPYSLCIDSFDNIYFSDHTYSTIRKIDLTGTITTIAGIIGSSGYTGDGGPASAAQIIDVESMCTDKLGNVYLGSGTIRKITVSTGIITTVAGNDVIGYTGEGVLADTTEIAVPFDMHFDLYGSLFLAETSNNRVRKIDTFGYMYTVAGNGIASYSGDGGPATNAEIYWPEGVAFDACGNLYIDDLVNNRVRKVLFNPSCDIPLIANGPVSKAQIAVYPSPTYDQLTITSTSAIHEVTVSNLIGQQVLDQVYDVEKAEVNVSGLPPGVYLVRVTDEDGNAVVRKVLKE